MEINTIGPFLEYYEKIRQRTLKVIERIPPDKIDWTYKVGKFTFADLIRHIASIERYMYAENARLRPSRYPGHGRELADGYDAVMAFFAETHRQSVEILRALGPEDLERKCLTPAGVPITVWKWLRAMVEHEIHHRGQLYVYLGLVGVPAP